MDVESQHTHAHMVHGSSAPEMHTYFQLLTECWRLVRYEKSENIIHKIQD